VCTDDGIAYAILEGGIAAGSRPTWVAAASKRQFPAGHSMERRSSTWNSFASSLILLY
jgi:hypothetical protein